MAVSPEAAAIIQRKKLQYCRWADHNQFHLFDQIALPEATFSFWKADGTIYHEFGVDYSFRSREEFINHFTTAFKSLQSYHMITPAEFEQTSPDEINAIFGCIYHAGIKGSDTEGHGTGGGHYHETWVRKGGDWFMKDLKFERIYWKAPSS
ncbi:hypothetical protein DL764_001698 [Monosporascus ibericus]|uniref:SnoaL-like domain-containing protein n=1 Tax=Monosporascus ibericus TaxID=155417 RepID=A0A4Q4TRX8_9PEZI|nr:hypothetical protein DL764_001698 [Monosporascus ibericus]